MSFGANRILGCGDGRKTNAPGSVRIRGRFELCNHTVLRERYHVTPAASGEAQRTEPEGHERVSGRLGNDVHHDRDLALERAKRANRIRV